MQNKGYLTLVCSLCFLQGATDLEKQLELLVVENQRLKQELNSCRSPHCTHSQVLIHTLCTAYTYTQRAAPTVRYIVYFIHE